MIFNDENVHISFATLLFNLHAFNAEPERRCMEHLEERCDASVLGRFANVSGVEVGSLENPWTERVEVEDGGEVGKTAWQLRRRLNSGGNLKACSLHTFERYPSNVCSYLCQ